MKGIVHLTILASLLSVSAFRIAPVRRTTTRTLMTDDADIPFFADRESAKSETKISLEEKMAKWEATEEEVKASTLGGVIPSRTDGFDIGLYVAFPFMILGSLGFALFPFIMDKIDVSSVGPPPTM